MFVEQNSAVAIAAAYYKIVDVLEDDELATQRNSRRRIGLQNLKRRVASVSPGSDGNRPETERLRTAATGVGRAGRGGLGCCSLPAWRS